MKPITHLQVTAEAEPATWGAARPRGAPGGALPFAQARFEDVRLDLAVLGASGGTHLSVTAAGAGLADLRLAFCETMGRCEARAGSYTTNAEFLVT